jgi:polysaccharide biosynthesis transport protein
MVPAIGDAGLASHAVLDQPNVPPGFSEAFRRVRGNVWLGVPSARTGVLLVTSAAPREGKTLVAANLAAAMAASGERVLLVDADMRRPRQHEVLSVSREPGLSSVLAGRAPLASAILATALDRLSLLPAGPQPPNPTELLDRNRFRLLLDSLDGQFDWVVIDSAPVLAVADAAVIARDVSGVVFVACADQTRRDAAQEAVQQLRATSANLIGAVLNRVDLARQAGYYSRYYRRDYEKYYVRQE